MFSAKYFTGIYYKKKIKPSIEYIKTPIKAGLPPKRIVEDVRLVTLGLILNGDMMTDKAKIEKIKPILDEVLEKANFEHIENDTSIFMDMGEKLDSRTVDVIKSRIKLWVCSWVYGELDKVHEILHK